MAKDTVSFSFCLFFKRHFRMFEAEPPQDVKEEFLKYAKDGKHMTVEQLRFFLEDFQGEIGVSVTEAEEIVKRTLDKRRHITNLVRRSLTLEDFHYYLFTADLNPPIPDQVHHDMTAPLSHYFIFTGHNSYLTGNQITSDCSDVPIIKALKNGVKVVELDLWPKKDNDVHVLHGRTPTAPVALIKCLESIRDNAFKRNPYPVIITLEDHLTPKLQEKVAQMIDQTFKGILFRPEGECLEEFPSPAALEDQIIISTKLPKPHNEDIEEGKNNSQKGKGWQLLSNLSLRLPISFKVGCGELRKKQLSLPIDREDEDEIDDKNSDISQEDEDEDDDGSENGLVSSKAPEYKHLIAIHAGKPKGGSKNLLKVEHDKVRRLSLSERKLKKVTDSRGTDVVRFTQKNMLRIYPKGSRIDSSNYSPLLGWMHGAQMVAFNMQGNDKHLWLMQGMFRANGGCGYVKKPDILMNVGPDGQVFDPKATLPVKKTLKVKVYMGDGWNLEYYLKPTHFDLYSPPDFYARIGMEGVNTDKKRMQKTRTVNNRWTPVWNEEFTFELTVPELALLRVEVFDEDDVPEKGDFAGQTCLPVSELKPGIRAVPLFDEKGKKYNHVRLLMRFEFV